VTIEQKSIDKSLVFPLYVKPVDSSGSKGVSIVNNHYELDSAIITAMQFSDRKTVIIEEEILSVHNQFHGDGFVVNGKIVFLGVCEQFFLDNKPIGSIFPARLSKKDYKLLSLEISKVIKLSEYSDGAFNFEARLSNGNFVILEIGPRSGGNMIPQLMEYATGFQETLACINVSNGKSIYTSSDTVRKRLQYIIHSDKDGYFNDIRILENPYVKLIELFLFVRQGDKIKRYTSSSNVIGVAIMEFYSNQIYSDFQMIMSRIVEVNYI
jgi:biotin carboxylase